MALPRAISRAACSRRQACQLPAKNRDAAGLQLQHGRADGLQEPAVVRDQHDGRVEPHECLLEPLQGLDVEMVGRLVQQQHVRRSGQRAGQRGARELASGERVQRPVQIAVGEPEAVRHRGRTVAPQVSAARLQTRLRTGVAGERGLIRRAGGHARLELGQLGLDLQLLGAA